MKLDDFSEKAKRTLEDMVPLGTHRKATFLALRLKDAYDKGRWDEEERLSQELVSRLEHIVKELKGKKI